MKKAIVFDFDKTLTYKDTIWPFFCKASSRRPLFFINVFFYFCSILAVKFGVISTFKLKDFGVRLFLNGMSKDELKIRANEFIRDITLNKVYYEYFIARKEDPRNNIYVVSASFEEYLNELFIGAKVVASRIRYNEFNVPCGVLSECAGKNKVKMLKKLGVSCIDELFTDSMSDFPLVEISKVTYFVKGDSVIKCYSPDEFLNCFRH